MMGRMWGWLFVGSGIGVAGCHGPADGVRDAADMDVAEVPGDVAEDASETPDVVADVPEDLSETPDVRADVPEDLSEMPDVLADVPVDLSETPDVLADVPAVIPTLRATFDIDRTTIAADPERGFYRWAGDITTVSASTLQSLYTSGVRLVYAMVRLDDVRTTAIGATRLAAIATGFGRLRAAGLKAIVRVVYNYPNSETEYRDAQDATLAQVTAHIAEIGPTLADNADVIAFIQAGFIGAWGEWHTSSNSLTTATNRTTIRDALLAHFPAERTISFRYPPHIRGWYPALPTIEAVLDGTFPRVGFHNDCFLASASDVGTYPTAEREQIRAYMMDFGQLLPFGGETCNPADDVNPTSRMACADILAEGPAYGLTYLNRDYWQTFHDGWRTEGCFDEVQRSMGHRLSLVELALPASVRRGESVEVTIGIRNDGWARVHNGRPVVLVLGTGAAARRVAIDCADLRSIGRGTSATFSCALEVPADLAVGTVPVAVQVPDAAPALATDVRFTTRLFNADAPMRGQRWNGDIGTFDTGLIVEVF